ncbi:hypothetical protein M413DRAFT_442359 [Hebeloma cylindrosporum]|uniref:Uncharacterized protein n=1 Tax=Hebeloma cylindrosporum TaxID=76867 RepID=A0A0C3CAA2_HEBCY|nr:hypothetical protein M413DRAFT_442359 [Hebeloma cylindrosporum h7]
MGVIVNGRGGTERMCLGGGRTDSNTIRNVLTLVDAVCSTATINRKITSTTFLSYVVRW